MSDSEVKNSIPPVVAEETELLTQITKHLSNTRVSRPIGNDYDEDLIALRDEIAQAHPEDIPPLVEHMTRLQALAAQRGQGNEAPIDVRSPYFGHIQFKEEEGIRDVMVGKRTYISSDSKVRIVDWRNAPVSRMYYSYEEGDDYEEVFGGRLRNGTVTARRSVTITDGELRRVACHKGTFARKSSKEHGDTWVELDISTIRLAGGQGKSTRAEGLSSVRGKLGVDADGTDRKDKFMPEIAALLDKRQFDLISSASSGLLIVQGSAGSGKTTVGLHRVAYLAFKEPRKFRASRMMVIVFNEGLANYISRVLPALGVPGVNVTTFDTWVRTQRMRNVHGLPKSHSKDTPPVVSRLKKHPAMLRILDEIVDVQDEQITAQLFAAVAGQLHEERVKKAWNLLYRIPLDSRCYRLSKWLDGEVRIGSDNSDKLDFRTITAAESALKRITKITSDVINDWADLFTDREALGHAFETHAPTEFSDSQLDSVHEWCVHLFSNLESADDDDPPMLDREDEAILVRLHQLKKGWLRGRGGRVLYDHIMIDEVQDLSPIEVRTMMATAGNNGSMTFAGDMAQRIIRDSGVTNWDEMLLDLGINGSRMEPLKIAYRSTVEIMRIALDVLGPLAEDPPLAKRHGAPVEMHRFSDPGQAVGFIGEALRDLSIREPMANVAVIARHLSQARLYYEGLQKAEVARLNLVVDENFSFKPGVEVTEVRQVKGLEFDYVIMVDVNVDSYGDNDESRHMMHVGVTRAAHQLWLLCTGTPSPILPSWLEGE